MPESNSLRVGPFAQVNCST